MSYQSVKSLLSKGISRPTLFQVIMPVGREAQGQLTFLCKSASIPEVSVETIAVNGQEALGVIREQPTFVTYAKPFSITVISDRDYTVYKEMRKWLDTLAVNANPNQRTLFNLSFGSNSQRINYYDSFKRQITLKKLEQSGESQEGYFQPLEVEFNNAYPVRVGSLGLDTESVNSRMEFTVDFTYDTYTLDSTPRENVPYE